MKWLLSIPGLFVSLAVCLALGFACVELLGWREMTAVLSGTFPSGDQWWDSLRALFYLACYFGCIVAAPILVLAALFVTGFRRLATSRSA